MLFSINERLYFKLSRRLINLIMFLNQKKNIILTLKKL